MLFLSAAAGWLVGILLNWGADFLPRYAASSSAKPLRSSRRSNPDRRQPPTAARNWSRLLRLDLGVEVLTAALFAWLWGRPASLVESVGLSLLCAFLVLVAIIDLKYRLVLNVMVFPAAVLAVLIRYISPGTNILTVLLGGAFGFAIFALAAFVRPGGLGGGDIKLATLIGLVFGFPNALWALMIGIFAGGTLAILLLLNHHGDSKSEIPYAPFLCLGALVALYYNPVPLILYPFMGH
jgi:prepilin signal peptidase PulO-like enzyme (type II secretory pathway)